LQALWRLVFKGAKMRFQYRSAVGGVLVSVLAACTSVRTVKTEPAPFISAKNPNIVYVVDKDGRLFTIARPQVRGDSVVGVSPSLNKSVGLPLSAVSTLAASQGDSKRTILLVGVLGAGAGGLVFAAAHAGSSQTCDATTLDPKGFQSSTDLCH
jgi:hypothetical protein